MDYSQDKLLTKKNILTLLFLTLLVVAIPFGVELIKKSQIFQSRAAQATINFTGDSISCDEDGECTTTSDTVEVELFAPWPMASPSP